MPGGALWKGNTKGIDDVPRFICGAFLAQGTTGGNFAPDSAVLNCACQSGGTGLWTVFLPRPLASGSYIWTPGQISGVSPGTVIGVVNTSTTTKDITIRNSNTGALTDIDICFSIWSLT